MNGLVSLYEAGFDERYIDEAVRLADVMLSQFLDSSGGGFFYTADDQEHLIARQKDWQDSSTPSGNAMAATALLRLGKLTGRADYLDAAAGTLQAAAGLMAQFPSAAGQMLMALDMQLGPTHEIVVVGREDDADTKALLKPCCATDIYPPRWSRDEYPRTQFARPPWKESLLEKISLPRSR